MKYLLPILLFLSCSKKNNTECEQWVYRDECEPKSELVFCGDDRETTGTFCGDDLKDARSGRSKVIDDNADRKLTRHYIRKYEN